MDWLVSLIFIMVYLGMLLGRVPGLALDRTGVALLGAIALLVSGKVTLDAAWNAVDVPTIGLLFGLMVLSAQLRLGGMYTAITRRITLAEMSPRCLLASLIGMAGLLSALLANDIICIAVAPLLVEACARRRLNPIPFLLGLACAANIGSAATLIGNPQNMLIGQSLGLSFSAYLFDGGVPAAIGLILLWLLLCLLTGNNWYATTAIPQFKAPVFNPWQSGKGLAILTVLVVAFLASSIPREILALAAAGIILTSRRMHSRHMLALVDWQLLILFISLFIVNHALESTSVITHFLTVLANAGFDIREPGKLFVATAVFSNMVSNVPAVMLLLPAATHPLAGPILALSSTLAGNLIIVG
ncbi:MAG: anion transporter, partial [Phycisphaerales bacterium]|nr:anion transporter [Phycisphaerales bacterium]